MLPTNQTVTPASSGRVSPRTHLCVQLDHPSLTPAMRTQLERAMSDAVEAFAKRLAAGDECEPLRSVASHLLELDERAHRVISHTSKRVMANASQMCALVLKRLEDNGMHQVAKANGIVGLLETTAAESASGYQMCRSQLLQASVMAGGYTPEVETFSLAALFNDLGFLQNCRFIVTSELPDVREFAQGVRVDRQLLTTVLFNAAQNALVHGAPDGPIELHACKSVELKEGKTGVEWLVVRICNRPGRNHPALVAGTRASGVNNLYKHAKEDLVAMGIGDGLTLECRRIVTGLSSVAIDGFLWPSAAIDRPSSNAIECLRLCPMQRAVNIRNLSIPQSHKR